MAEVPVDQATVAKCRARAAAIADDVQRCIDAHTTVGVERTVARAYGVTGADPEGTPLANALVDRIHRAGHTGLGVAWFLGQALLDGASSVQDAAEALAFGETLPAPTHERAAEIRRVLAAHTDEAMLRMYRARDARDATPPPRGRFRPLGRGRARRATPRGRASGGAPRRRST